MEIVTISGDEATAIIEQHESHFIDFKAKEISGKKLQKIVVAFANADGGEALVGVEDTGTWSGFDKPEDANQLVQTVIQDISPSVPIQLELYKTQNKPGFILRINVAKSADVHYTSDKQVYVRKGAQSLPITGNEITNLKLSKGLISFEDQTNSGYTVDELSDAEELRIFLSKYSPISEPVEFLKKQRLVRGKDFMPTVAGVLLFSDLPSAILSKKCEVKITRYDTSESEPQREHLKQQYTIEGPLKVQIDQTVELIQKEIESVRIYGDVGLEKPKYPVEAIKEILVNALIHRDYNISDDVHVFIFNNRIEIRNPGRLPGHITPENIFEERFARNPTVVRILNKYPDAPNKDIGEGLNTALQKMQEVRLKPLKIEVKGQAVVVTLPHEPLAAPADTVMEYLELNEEVSNRVARKLTGIKSENSMKDVFYKLRDLKLIERVPGKEGPSAAWRKVKR